MASKTSKYWDDRALRRLTGAEKTSEEYIKRVRKMYDKAYRDLNKDIETIYKNYSKDTGIDVDTLKTLLTKKETDKVFKELKAKGYDKYVKDNYKSRITRLEQLKAQIYTKAKDVYSEEELINHQCYSEVYKNSYYRTIYDTQMGTGYNFGFGTIDDNLVKAVLNERWSGKNYKARVWGNTDILAESVSEIVGASILNGQSLSKTSKEIRERFGVSKYYAERLIRTETNHFYNEADAMAYEEMGIDKYVFVAVLDNRTSPMCQDHDNKVYDYKDKKEGVNFPPLHPNCRSTTRGYLGEEAEKHLQRRARDPKTGKSELIGNMSYKEWAKTKGIDVAVTKRGGQLPAKSKVNASKSVKTTPRAILNTDTYKRLTANLVEFKPVSKLIEPLTSDKIIEKIAGADKTKGSCVSLGLSYIGNKMGYDVTDFRGGNSCNYFSRQANWLKALDDMGVKYLREIDTNDYKAVGRLLDNTYYDKEYFLITGSHASIIKHTKEAGWQYLELQSSKFNGYKPLNNEILKTRFRCKKSHSVYGNKLEATSVLLDINDFKNNNKFKDVLGYINTSTDKQVKGAGGYAK